MDAIKALQSSHVDERIAAARVILNADKSFSISLLINQFMSHPGFENEQHQLKDCLHCAVKWLESELTSNEFAILNHNPFTDTGVLPDIYFDEQTSELTKGAVQASLDLFETDGGNRTLQWLERLFKTKNHPWDTKWVRFKTTDISEYSNYFFIKFISLNMWNSEKRVLCVFSNGSTIEMPSDIIEFSGDFIDMNEHKMQSVDQYFERVQNLSVESMPESQITELRTTIEVLKTKAAAYGLISLEIDRPGIKHPLLRLGLEMAIDGYEPDAIQRTLESLSASLSELDQLIIDTIKRWFQLSSPENQFADAVKRDTDLIKKMMDTAWHQSDSFASKRAKHSIASHDSLNCIDKSREPNPCAFHAFRFVRLFNDIKNACNKNEVEENPFISNTFDLFRDAFLRSEQLPTAPCMDMIYTKVMVARELDLRENEMCLDCIKNIQSENHRVIPDYKS